MMSKQVSHLCPVCDGAKKWHRDGSLCNLPLKETFGVVCYTDHTVCLLCKGTGRVTYEYTNDADAI
jgi:hypothetical protein